MAKKKPSVEQPNESTPLEAVETTYTFPESGTVVKATSLAEAVKKAEKLKENK